MAKTRKVESGPASAVQIVGYTVPPAGAVGDISTPAANKVAEITYPRPGANCYHSFSELAWSYDGQLAGELLLWYGNLQMIDEYSGVIFDIDITHAGPGFIPFPVPKRGSSDATMTVRLAAGGVGVKGKLNVLTHWIEKSE